MADVSRTKSTEPSDKNTCALHTDMYQITMTYAYWKNQMHNKPAVFDLFFRKAPFDGEYTLFAGLSEVLQFVSTYRFKAEHLEYLRDAMPGCDPEFFTWLASVNCANVKIYALPEGSVCFPRVPLLRVEGPLGICQLLETTLLNLINFPTLIATNAIRMRIAAGETKTLLEFGLRRAQGPNGALSASRYAFLGGFDGTSNLLAGLQFGIPAKGTHAHSFVQSFTGLSDLRVHTIVKADGEEVNFVTIVNECRDTLRCGGHEGELAAFVAYAQAFPSQFVALVDTYDTLDSGVPNFMCVAWALIKVGYTPAGCRLDSGDLAYLSKQTRATFEKTSTDFNIPELATVKIVASNDINEDTLYSLASQGHCIDTFGIGTHLVTCQNQPALGAVYKLVELDNEPRIKISNAATKVTIPCRKDVYRLYSKDGVALIDVLVRVGDTPPMPHMRFLCRHPFDPTKRASVTPTTVSSLLQLFWDGTPVSLEHHKCLEAARQQASDQLATIREDVKRKLNPTPYKVAVTGQLYDKLHALWMQEAPVAELS